MASASPVQLLAMMQAIGNGVLGRPAAAPLPRIVASYRLLGDDGIVPATAHTETAVDFDAYFATSGTAGFVEHVLSAPLKPGGTLAALASVANGGRHLAKTGTTTTGDGGIRDKWVIGVRGTTAGPRSYALLIGAADPGQPLGRKISANSFAAVLGELWR